MNTPILSFFATLVPLLAIDGVWLSVMTKYFYGPRLSHLIAANPQILPAVIFYVLYAFGVLFFVVTPALKGEYSLGKVFLVGTFLGLIAYAAYDFTNQATLKDWPVIVTCVDLAWGAFLTGTGSVIAVLLTKYFS